MKKFFSVLTALALMAASLVVAEIYDAMSFVETCGDFTNQPVSEMTWEITQSELTWDHSKNDDVIFVYQNNILLSDRLCSLHHSNGLIVNATWK